jgi:hypothetical protein
MAIPSYHQLSAFIASTSFGSSCSCTLCSGPSQISSCHDHDSDHRADDLKPDPSHLPGPHGFYKSAPSHKHGARPWSSSQGPSLDVGCIASLRQPETLPANQSSAGNGALLRGSVRHGEFLSGQWALRRRLYIETVRRLME